MADLELICLNKNCQHHFQAKNVKPGDIRTCFHCGTKRKILQLYINCDRCKLSYSITVQDGIRVSACPRCGNYNPIFNPIYMTSKKNQTHGRSKKQKRR